MKHNFEILKDGESVMKSASPYDTYNGAEIAGKIRMKEMQHQDPDSHYRTIVNPVPENKYDENVLLNEDMGQYVPKIGEPIDDPGLLSILHGGNNLPGGGLI